MSEYVRMSDTGAGIRHMAGIDPTVIFRAREGLNVSCVGCGGETLAGGLRCLDCFRMVARPVRKGCGTESGYRQHLSHGQRPCNRCREAHAEGERVRAVLRRSG